jgi:peptidoglycan hydrolase CwlO-like protein
MNLEDRMISVESSIRTLSKVATQQMLHNRETDEHLTMLLGIAKGQEGDISAMKADIGAVQADISTMKADVSTVQADVSSIKGTLSRMETRIGERFDAIIALLQSNQSKQ